MLKLLIDFLFPPMCPVCGRGVSEHGQLCSECWNEFDWISNPKCRRCGYPFPANIENSEELVCPDCMRSKSKIDVVRSACVYDSASRNVMLPFKHGGRLEYQKPMSRAMMQNLREIGPADLVLPVPLARRRLWSRGYNQAAELARPIARRLGVSVDYDSVIRKYRPDMGHKNKNQRKKNISGVFDVVRPKNIRGRRILLVDDVYTTGATFDELAKVLKKAGAVWVGGITFCRVVRAI